MRTEKNRKKINTLFLFGAGASKSLTNKLNTITSTPLDSEFTQRIKDAKSNKKFKWVNDAKNRIIKGWLYHIEFEKLGLEKAISQQISDLEFLKAIHPRKGNHSTLQIKYLEDINHLISYVLSKARLKDKRLLEIFINKFFKEDKIENCHNRIITFNYDTLIDNALIEKYKDVQKIYFDSIGTSSKSKVGKPGYKFPILLKLHGSLNWKCDRADYEKIFSSTGTPVATSRTKTYNTKDCHFIENIWVDKKIENPGNNIFPLIIPPIPDKPITNVAIFRYLWTYAFEYLHDCNELVVSGYSLPETDTLATSLFSKFQNKDLKKVTIIDPSPQTIIKWVTLFNRKGVLSPKIEYYTDFSSYLKQIK